MAPIRRYLRISKYSVLECRIYLDNPALAQSWLLNSRNPMLPQVIESVRPLVLPKLREERERAKKKSTRKKQIKDVIVRDEFEVSIFLTETPTRHSLLRKHRLFEEKGKGKMQSNSSKLISETNEQPVDIEEVDDPLLREEDSDDEGITLTDIPAAPSKDRQVKRRRGAERPADAHDGTEEEENSEAPIEVISDDEFEDPINDQPPTKRARRPRARQNGSEENEDDKKKMSMDLSYEGFAIYGRVLCLVVKKRETQARQASTSKKNTIVDSSKGTGHAAMENWISSTQEQPTEDS